MIYGFIYKQTCNNLSYFQNLLYAKIENLVHIYMKTQER